MIRLFRWLVALLGVTAIVLSAAAAFAPGEMAAFVPLEGLVDASPLGDSSVRSLVFAAIGASCLLWVVWTAGPDRTERFDGDRYTDAGTTFHALRENPPEQAAPGPLVGDEFDDNLALDVRDAVERGSPERSRQTLRDVAVTVVCHVEDCSTDRSRELVDSGEWTDDPVAAAYIADDEQSLPLYRRLLAWLRPLRTTVKRVERSVKAIESLAEEGMS